MIVSIKLIADKFSAFIKCFCDTTFFYVFKIIPALEVLT